MRQWQGFILMGLLIVPMACNTGRSPNTQPPIPPTDFSATVVSSTAIRLSWTASSGATGYVLERKTGVAEGYTVVATPTASPYEDKGLNPATEYSYRIKARNSAGTSAEVQTSVITPGSDGSGVSKIGVISLGESGGVGFASAFFIGTNQTLAQPPNGLYPGNGTCTVSKTNSLPNPPNLPDLSSGFNPISLDAGPQIRVKSEADTYAVLQRQTDKASITYQATNLQPLPASAAVDIPGSPGGFPAFSSVALPSIPTDFNFAATPSLDAVGKDSSFSWSTPLGSAAQMVFVGYQLTSESEYIGFSCVAPDTGNFSFPPQTSSELEAAGFSQGQLFLAIRQSSRTEVQGNNHLVLNASRGKLLYAVPGQ